MSEDSLSDRHPIASARKAGDLVFAGGIDLIQFGSELNQRPHPLFPHHGALPIERQLQHQFDNLSTALEASGSSLADLLSINAFHTDPTGIDPALRLRSRTLQGLAPPASTLVMIDGLPSDSALATMDVIALAREASALPSAPQTDQSAIPAPALLSIYGTPVFSPLKRGGGLLFTQGKGMTAGTSVAGSAKPWSIWPAEAQTEAILDYLEALLRVEGATLADVVRAEITVNDPDDLVGLERVWRKRFAEAPPARMILPARLALSAEVLVEISLIAIDPAGGLKRRAISPKNVRSFGHESPAVQAGPYLFLSTRVAEAPAAFELPDANKVTAAVTAAVNAIESIFLEAGGGLQDIVRRRCFTSSANSLAPAEAIWRDRMPMPFAPTTFALTETLGCWPHATALYDITGHITLPQDGGGR